MNVEAARMISKSNRRIKRSNDVRATAEDGRTAEDGTGCGACQQVETVKKKEFRGRKPRTKKVTDKDNYRHYYILNSRILYGFHSIFYKKNIILFLRNMFFEMFY
jgi:hypothetical protein